MLIFITILCIDLIYAVIFHLGFKHADNGVIKPAKAPMSDTEFQNYLDSAGFMVKPIEFRQSVYQGGIEHSLRRVAWRHLLSIYPAHLSSKDRFRYLKYKEDEYQKLKEAWCEKFRNNAVVDEVKHVVSMVEKDVLRTDRSHSFYSGSDENKNTLSLFHVLVTYALTHPDVSYCQGMSDLASPLLVTQKNEGQAYICFCALMRRLQTNFTTEGSAIMMKFHHLSELLNMYDPVLYSHLLQNTAGDMFFCYRWFLLEMKREFPFNDALHVLEVMWATLPHCPPDHGLELVDPGYSSQLLSTSPCSPSFSQKHNMYTKLLAMRRGGVLHRGTKSVKSTASLIPPRAFTNNSVSTESLSHCDEVSTNRSSISSFDTSPSDREVRDNSFPKIDHSVAFCLHKKLDNIGHILKNRQLYEEYTNDNEENDSDVKKNKICYCNNDNDQNGSDWAVTNANYLCNTLTKSFDIGHSSSSLNELDLYQEHSGSTQQDSDLNDDRRSWSLHSISSGSSETGCQQIQFTISMDSNTNNSTNVSNTTADLGNCTSSSDSAESVSNVVSQSQNTESSSIEIKVNDTRPKAASILLSTPKTFSPLASRHLPLHAGAGNSEITKNLSDSHISDCQEATEEFGSSESTCSQFTGTPVRDPSKLPPPPEFGAGNPFLMFLSLTLLLQHREIILSQNMCYEEIAMYFDRLVRKHNAKHTLQFTRQIYTEYLQAQQANVEDDKDLEFSLNF